MNYGEPEVGKLFTTRDKNYVALITKIIPDFKLFYNVYGVVFNLETKMTTLATWTRDGYTVDRLDKQHYDLMELYGDEKTHPEYYL